MMRKNTHQFTEKTAGFLDGVGCHLLSLPFGPTCSVMATCHCYCVAKSCLTLCNTMECSTSGFPVLNQLPHFAQTHVHGVRVAIQLSNPLSPFSSCLQSFPASGSFQISQLFTSGGQSIGASNSESVLPIYIQD